MRTFTTYPVGATWECTDAQGRHGWIKLADRKNTFEMWTYGWRYEDGSGGDFDWAMSYALAKKNHRVAGRFKRVK